MFARVRVQLLILGRGVDFDDLDYGYKEEDKSSEKVARSEWLYTVDADVSICRNLMKLRLDLSSKIVMVSLVPCNKQLKNSALHD